MGYIIVSIAKLHQFKVDDSATETRIATLDASFFSVLLPRGVSGRSISGSFYIPFGYVGISVGFFGSSVQSSLKFGRHI